jgi:hypothetical protein
MIRVIHSVFILILFLGGLTACNGGKGSPNSSEEYNKRNNDQGEGERYVFQIDTPYCDDNGCRGRYAGVEFVDEEYQIKLNLTGTDIAHNYSNVISKYVGNQLKKLFKEKKYARVDFSRIKMTTKGMGDGDDYVVYRVVIPFKRVDRPELATTGFDHCGGWGHPPDIRERVQALTDSPKKIVKNNKLWISPLFKTREGLEEYWIQWQHTSYQ